MISFLKKRKVFVGQQTELVFMQKLSSKGLFEKCVLRNFEKFTKKTVAESRFLINLNSVDLQLH